MDTFTLTTRGRTGAYIPSTAMPPSGHMCNYSAQITMAIFPIITIFDQYMYVYATLPTYIFNESDSVSCNTISRTNEHASAQGA